MVLRVQHPRRSGVHAVCGYSSTRGDLYIEVWDHRHVTHHSSATTGSPVPLREILGVFVAREFFTWADVHLAHREIQMRLLGEIIDPDVKLAAELLEALKDNAGG